MKKITFLLIALCGMFTSLMAQSGIISGKITEADSGFEVIGGTVVIQGTDKGTVTDIDGTYQLDVEAGTYTVEVSYVGFATQEITDVIVTASTTTSLDVQLGESAIELEGVEIVAKAFKNTEAAVLAIQKTAPVVLDGISSAQISKSGDNDVAAAVKRVTGVTVEGGKYVYVRGLGDRYSKTTLNGAAIPGLDPNRNTVQMDLFPTNLVDNILVYKTFAPNLPGDFTGGYVDIATKDFPEQFTLNASASVGYNPQANLNKNFLTYNGGSRDVLGFDDGSRAIPSTIAEGRESIPNYSEGLNDASKARALRDATEAFNNNWSMYQEGQPVNSSFSLSAGNQKTLFGKPLGFIAAMTYQRSFRSYDNGAYGIYELTGNVANTSRLNTQLLLDDNKSEEETLWGAMFSTSYKMTPNNKVNLTLMHNQSATSTARFLEGTKFRDDADDIFQTRTWQFLERGLSTAQLSGKHSFGERNAKLSWISSYAMSSQDEPDLRYFTNRINGITGNAFIKPSSDNVPTRFYRNMQQNNWDNKVDFTLPFDQWSGMSAEFKVGAGYLMKARTFREDRFNFNNNELSIADGDIFAYFHPDNILMHNPEDVAGYDNGGNGIYVADNYDPKNNYNAAQSVASAYAMVQLPLTDKLSAVAGVRAEQTAIQLETFDTDITLDRYPTLDGEQNILNNLDILPSLNLNYELGERSKLRFGYNKTIARPSFRELAPFASFAVDGGFVFVGNPDLQRTTIDNVDLRWEMYPQSGEIISVSTFYKQFTNPIERTFNPEAQNTELTLRNVDAATLIGAEVEVRKNLGVIADKLAHFDLGANFTYVYSRTAIDAEELALIRANDSDANGFREMYGQSPYVINALLGYKNDKGTKANLSFNIVGSRISTVTRGATPNYYQKARPSLNFNIAQRITDHLSARFSANNLLDADYQEIATYKGVEYPIASYQMGRTFSLGINYKLSK